MPSTRRRGFTVIEFLVASTLLLAGLSASGAALSRSLTALADGRARDDAAALAYSVLERADAFGCGLGTASPLAAVGEARAAQRCGGLGTGADGGTGDVSFVEVRNGRDFTVEFRAAWRRVGGVGGADPCAAPGPAGTAGLLVRRVVVRTARPGPDLAVVAETAESVPPDAAAFRDPHAGGVLVRGTPPGAAVRLHVDGAVDVTRHAAESGAGAGCVWFPFLPAGVAATVTVDGRAAQTVTVPANDTVVLG